jgi:hypothetical protein
MILRIRDFFVNREWAMFVGIVTTLVTSGEEFLEFISVTAAEQNDWTPLGLLPLVAAIVTRARVWSKETIDKL